MLPSGGYLIVEKTEAMHVVDVNSGSRKGGRNSQEQNALEIDVEAAKEIARLLRLRDMGGIICVDFIDLYESENRRTLHKVLKDAMADDKAKHNVLPPSKFGAIEMTRQRVRPETEIDTSESCPTCGGTGEVSAPVLIVDEIENGLNYLLRKGHERRKPARPSVRGGILHQGPPQHADEMVVALEEVGEGGTARLQQIPRVPRL